MFNSDHNCNCYCFVLMPVPDLVYRIKKERKRTDASDFQYSFDLTLYLHLGKSPQIVYVKRRQNLLPIAFKADQSDLYCWFSHITTAPGLPLVRGTALGERYCPVASSDPPQRQTKLLPKKVASEAKENP